MAEVKTARDEVKAKAIEIKLLQDQLQKTKEQLGCAQMTIASMVSRSELDAAESHCNDLQRLMMEHEVGSRKSVDCLQEQAREYKSEIDELKAAIQAIRIGVHCCFETLNTPSAAIGYNLSQISKVMSWCRGWFPDRN